jgi:hypothetical protein
LLFSHVQLRNSRARVLLIILLICVIVGQAVIQTSMSQPAPQLTPSEQLLGSGAKWAAQNGTSALYIDWFDNYNAHHLTDGANWGPYWGADYLSAIKNGTVLALEQQGFNVTCTGDVPNDLSNYNLVVFEAWFAVEPKDNQLVRNYLSNGGNVVIIGGVPCYFSTYCKDMWPYQTGGENLSSLQDWFGCSLFANSGGSANLTEDNPFGTSLLTQNQLYYVDAYSCYALDPMHMSSNSRVLARWSNGLVFAFTHEYGNGRVYYQATADFSSTVLPMYSSSLTLSSLSSTSYSSFKVEIRGNLTSNKIALTGSPILISYSIAGSNSWQDLASVNTKFDGSFLAEWLPSATGNYLINATFQGDSSHSSTSTVVNLAVMPSSDQNAQDVFSVSSNSTVSNLAFNSTSNELSFSVTGPQGTTGYLDAYVAKSLIGDISHLKVYLDGNQQNYTVAAQQDSYIIHFTYHHSTHLVILNLGKTQSKNTLDYSQLILIIGAVIIVLLTLILVLTLYFLNFGFGHNSQAKKLPKSQTG